MNAHRRMKAYMERHKIGLLFEELMSKLMSELPSEPVPFLIRQLQNRLYEVRPQTVMSLAQLRRSLEDLTTPLEVEKAHVYKKAPGSMISKRRPATASMPSMASSRKAVTLFCPGDIQPTMPNIDRRKLLQLTKPRLDQIANGNAGPDFGQHASPDFRQHASPKAVKSEEAEQHVIAQRNITCERCQSSGYSRSVLPGEILDEDPLRNEIAQQRMSVKFNNADKTQSKGFSEKQRAKEVLSKPQEVIDSRRLNGIKSERRYFDREPEVEMYENPEDLACEGIFVCKASNLKVYKFAKPMRCSNENWHFTVCSTCAKIVTDGGCNVAQDVRQHKTTFSRSDQERQFKTDRDAKIGRATSSVSSHVTDVKNPNSDLPSFRCVRDSERSMSTEDLFAETPRSLPLPATPTNREVDWCFPSVEFLQTSSSGWAMIGPDRYETDSP